MQKQLQQQGAICLALLAAALQLQPVTAGAGEHLKRLSRSLIYPKTAPTRLQFIGGIGIPVEDLHYESITSGYVLKVEYFLPTNASEYTHVYLRPQPITSRKNDNANELIPTDSRQLDYAGIYRWVIYRGIETVLDQAGFPGRACLLRVICEHAVLPVSHEVGLLAEVLHIILSPSSSRDAMLKRADRQYVTAERIGRRGGSCTAAYARKCPRSPMDMISMLMEVAS